MNDLFTTDDRAKINAAMASGSGDRFSQLLLEKPNPSGGMTWGCRLGGIVVALFIGGAEVLGLMGDKLQLEGQLSEKKVEVTFSPAPTRKGKANARKKNERPRENPERTQEEGRVSDVEARRCAGLGCRVRTGSATIAGAVAAGSITPNNKPPSGPVEYFLASDASAVIEHTRRVVYLEDGDIVYIRKQGTRWLGRG